MQVLSHVVLTCTIRNGFDLVKIRSFQKERKTNLWDPKYKLAYADSMRSSQDFENVSNLNEVIVKKVHVYLLCV